jgi:hypothetical protein
VAATVTIGIDIGQRVDPTAVAVAQQELRAGDEHFLVRHLERLPLGTPYPDVAQRLAAIVAGVEAQVGRRGIRSTITVYADATGVGTPVCDLLKASGTPVTPVFFTHGDRRTEVDGELRLGKAWLVSRLQALLQSGRLHLPLTGEAEALGRELLDYEIRVDENANDRYGAFKVGTHDDLVTALGLAVQPPKKPATLVTW